MKPDGVATEPMETEGMETEGMEPVTEPTGSDGASQNGTTPSPPQPDQPQNAVDAKSKSKGPVKGKTTAVAGPATTGPGTRPKATQSRVANGLTKTAASTTTKKSIPATTTAADKKKPTTNVGHSGPIKKPIGFSTAVATSRAQPKVTTVGSSRSTTTAAASGTKSGMAVSTATGLSRRPATSVGTKPKTTASAPRPAPAAKPSTSATAKNTAVPKTNRATGSSAPRSAAISATGRTITGTTTSTVTRTSRTATQQPVKPLVTASAALKDVGKTSTTAPAKRTVASTSRPASNKPSNSEAPKPAAAAKRPPPSIKAPQPKPDDKKSVPTRKVPPSPRNNPSRPASGKNAAASSSHRQAGSMVGVKLQPSKPTQSVLPLVVKGKTDVKQSAAKPDDKEPAAESVQLSAAAVATVAVATAAAIAREESVPGPEVTPTVESSLDVPTSSLDVLENVDVQVPNVTSQSVLDTSNTEPEAQEALIETVPVEVACPTSVIDQETEENVSGKVDEKLIMAVAPIAQEATEQETLTASPVNNSVATIVSSGVEVAEKAEPINSDCYEDVEEEEREGSQQVSLSEMSGTQPTEESRPGSAGLAGSVWRAGALLSELDSEDVSCSQQGASELSAPGVLEGTESMDDLGDASLKGADGEGASVGSPDFEKVPDILANEDDDDDDNDDDDDDDRVCDMEVGSERAEDSHRQHHGNEDDEEDDDVEMASEGITESGLESYGNADEDDLTEDYRLDNLNRIQSPPMVPSAAPATHWNQPSCFADAWAQPPQPASTLLSSPSSECWQVDPETPTQTPAQARSDVSSSSPLPPNLFEPPTSSPQQAPLTAAEGDVSPKPGMTPSQTCKFQPGTFSDPGLASDSNTDTSIPEEVEDCNKCSGTETHSKGELQPEPLSPVPTVLPDIMQDLGIHLQHADEEEEPETLPADDVLGGPATAPSSSSATEDEASDTEGEMQISGPQAELHGTGNAYGTAPVGYNVSSVEEREEMSGETEAGGGSETPQSATSAASYGFDYTTSNSNAQSSAESCSKSPGIFSLENEEQLPDEAKDPSLLKELILIPSTASGEKIDHIKSQHGEFQSHPEQQYMLCGESTELPEPGSVPGAVPLESGLTDPSSAQHQEVQDLDTQHPYYSTICEKTDSSLAERNFCLPPQPNDLFSIQMTMSSKLRLRPRAAHVTQPPRLPTDLPPRIPNAVSNTQLRCLEQHQQYLHEIQQRQEKCNREQERQEVREEKQVRNEREQQEEEQRRNLLELQLKQQEQELKQRQQIMQWQQELEQQQQQKHKVHTPVVLSPSSGLSTIYETVEASDTEDEHEEAEEVEDTSSFNACPGEDMQRCTEKNDSADLYLQYSTPFPESTTQDTQQELQETDPASHQGSPSPLGFAEQPPHFEFDWGKKVDIVHQLINQTLLLTGDGCSPLFLLPGGTGGTLSPLESSLWPNLLPPLTPPSATVTSVSSFSPEVPGSSAQGKLSERKEFQRKWNPMGHIKNRPIVHPNLT